MEAAFLIRLQETLTWENKKQSKFTRILLKFTYFLYLLPICYISSPIVSIISIVKPELSTPTLQQVVFGVMNIWLGVNELVMHSFFVWYILRAAQKSKKKFKLIFRAGILGTLSLGTFFGGIVTIYNDPIGTAILYGVWCWVMWVFLAVNNTVKKIMEWDNPTKAVTLTVTPITLNASSATNQNQAASSG